MQTEPRNAPSPRIRLNLAIHWSVTGLAFLVGSVLIFLLGRGLGDYMGWVGFSILIGLSGLCLSGLFCFGFWMVWYRWKHVHPVSFVLLGLLYTSVFGTALVAVMIPLCNMAFAF